MSNNSNKFRAIIIEKEDWLIKTRTHIATNLNEQFASSEVFGIYKRRGIEELAIKEMKGGFGAHYIPSWDDLFNELYFTLQVFAYNIILLLKFMLTNRDFVFSDNKNQHIRIKRFRFLFIK